MTDTASSLTFRMGEERDAADIARFYNMANNGLSEIWWSKQAKLNQTWLDAFVRDIKEENSIAYYGRCILAEVDGKVVGLLIAFPQEEIPPPEILKSLPSSERSILDLRRMIEGSLFIAVIAVDENYRRKGVARHFVNMSMNVAGTSNLKQAAVIVHESNQPWLESFLRRGFSERARNKVGDHAFYPQDSSWILVTIPVEPQQG